MAYEYQNWTSICQEAFEAKMRGKVSKDGEAIQWDPDTDQCRAYRDSCREIINGFLSWWGYSLGNYKQGNTYKIPSLTAEFFLQILKQDTKKGSFISKIKKLVSGGPYILPSDYQNALKSIKPEEVKAFIDTCVSEMIQNASNPDKEQYYQRLQELCENDFHRNEREKKIRDKVEATIQGAFTFHLAHCLSQFDYTQIGRALVHPEADEEQCGSPIGEDATTLVLFYVEQAINVTMDNLRQLILNYEETYLQLLENKKEGQEVPSPQEMLKQIGADETILTMALKQVDEWTFDHDKKITIEEDKANNKIRITLEE